MKIRSGFFRISFIAALFFVFIALVLPLVQIASSERNVSFEGSSPDPPGYAFSVLTARAAQDFGMSTMSYDVDVKVNENNTFEITESISVQFYVMSRGIIRDIPIRGEAISLVNGKVVKQDINVRIKNVSAGDDPFSTWSEDGTFYIRVGDPDIYLTGVKDYVINYTLELMDDRIKEYDSIYLNVIPKGWSTDIESTKISITFPKYTDPLP